MATTVPNWEKYFFKAAWERNPNLFILRTLNTVFSSHSESDSSTDAKHIIMPPPVGARLLVSATAEGLGVVSLTKDNVILRYSRQAAATDSSENRDSTGVEGGSST
jgi:hypothetical protein